MSTTVKIGSVLLLVAVAACARTAPEPEPAPIIQPEPVFTGKV